MAKTQNNLTKEWFLVYDTEIRVRTFTAFAISFTVWGRQHHMAHGRSALLEDSFSFFEFINSYVDLC